MKRINKPLFKVMSDMRPPLYLSRGHVPVFRGVTCGQNAPESLKITKLSYFLLKSEECFGPFVW